MLPVEFARITRSERPDRPSRRWRTDLSFTIDLDLLGLVDAVALVTGGGAGIGRGYAIQLARAGCHVAIAELDPEAGRRTAAEIEKLGRRTAVIEANGREQAQSRRMGEPDMATSDK